MTDSDAIAERIRDRLADRAGLTEDRVFDGIGFFVGGRMALAVLGDSICIRLGDRDDAGDADVSEPFTFAGRTIPGWVTVPSNQLDDEALGYWLELGLAGVESAV